MKMVGIALDRILLIGDDKSKLASHFLDFINAAQKVEPSQRIRSSPKDTALLMYSSGTTGLPKGVMLVHRSMAIQSVQSDAVGSAELSQRDTLMAVLPFSHIMGGTTSSKSEPSRTDLAAQVSHS